MTGMISSDASPADEATLHRASTNFALLMEHVAGLYCMGKASSISLFDAHQLVKSISYVLGIANASPEEAAAALDGQDPVSLWQNRLAELDARMDTIFSLWHEVVKTMPAINNVALRDTLISIGELRKHYDALFAAHEVPCDIDYQLSEAVDEDLLGLDYVEAWLEQLLIETHWIARFDTASCVRVLERICPDYRGLHVNLYDLLLPYECELSPSSNVRRVD